MAGKVQPPRLGTQYLGPDKGGPWATAARLARTLNSLRAMAVRFHDARVQAGCLRLPERRGKHAQCDCFVCGWSLMAFQSGKTTSPEGKNES